MSFSRCRIPALFYLLLSLLGLNACTTLPSFESDQQNIVVTWNELALSAVRTEALIQPTVVSRQLFLLHAAMYDAWSAFEPQAQAYALDPSIKVAVGQISEEAKVAAVSQAAYHILRHEFPRFENASKTFARQLTRLGLYIARQGDRDSAAGIGYLAAGAVLRKRADDGSNSENIYSENTSKYYPQRYVPVNSDDPRSRLALGQPGFNPNRWQPLRVPYPRTPQRNGRYIIDHDDRTTYNPQRFTTPHWGAVRPFALSSGSELRPPAPPQLGSDLPYTDAAGKLTTNDQAYREQSEELIQINASLTDRQKVIAEFWADGPRSESPPGHWNQLAHGISERDQHTLDDDVKMYFALNAALLDAGIAAWESKRYYDYVRPLSAIRHLYKGQRIRGWGGRNRGTEDMPGEQWQPYQQQTFITPPFPEYVSGHSAFSAAAATVLSLFTANDQFYDGRTRTRQDIDRDGQADLLGQFMVRSGSSFFEDIPAENVLLRWPTLQDAADEAAYSRRYGGIHFQDGDLRGRVLGRDIGQRALQKARIYWGEF